MGKCFVKGIFISAYNDRNSDSLIFRLRRDLEDRGYSVFLSSRDNLPADAFRAADDRGQFL